MKIFFSFLMISFYCISIFAMQPGYDHPNSLFDTDEATKKVSNTFQYSAIINSCWFDNDRVTEKLGNLHKELAAQDKQMAIEKEGDAAIITIKKNNMGPNDVPIIIRMPLTNQEDRLRSPVQAAKLIEFRIRKSIENNANIRPGGAANNFQPDLTFAEKLEMHFKKCVNSNLRELIISPASSELGMILCHFLGINRFARWVGKTPEHEVIENQMKNTSGIAQKNSFFTKLLQSAEKLEQLRKVIKDDPKNEQAKDYFNKAEKLHVTTIEKIIDNYATHGDLQ
jgi:hypothetical protein